MSPAYKASVLRGIISDTSYAIPLESLISTSLTAVSGWTGVYDGDEEKILAVFNKKRKVLRIRSDSPLVQMLQERKGWSVVPSNTLDKYLGSMKNIIASLKTEKLAQPIVKKILETDEGEVEIDLHFTSTQQREDVLYRILDRVEQVSAHKSGIVYNLCRRLEHQKYTVKLEKPAGKPVIRAVGYMDMPF